MAENLFLKLSSSADTQIAVEWMLLDDETGVIRFRGDDSLDTFSTTLADLEWSGRIQVFIPTEEVLLTTADIPKGQDRQILQAVPFMVEEHIASDIEQCHFAIGTRNAAGKLNVAIVENQRLQFWLDKLKEISLHPDVLTIDVLSVPYIGQFDNNVEQGSVIMFDGNRALIRSSLDTGIAVDISLTAIAVNLLSEADRQNLSFLQPEGHNVNFDQAALSISQISAELDVKPQVSDLEHAPFEILCRNFNVKSINLLQGEFKPSNVKTNQATPWKVVIVLAACAFILQLGLTFSEAYFLQLKANSAATEATALYRDIFPNDKNVRDMRRRWRSHLGEKQQNSGAFLPLFAKAVQQLPNTKLILNNINFNEGRGSLVLQLESPRREQLIQYSQTLNKLGLKAEIGTLNQGENTVKGSLKISMDGSS